MRAAIHPRSFIKATPTTRESTSPTGPLKWVSPQFEPSHLNTAPARRGRRKACSTTSSILDRCSQLSRKTSLQTNKFPALSFNRGPTQPPHLDGRSKQARGNPSKKGPVAALASTNRQESPPEKQRPSREAPLPSQQTPKRRTRGTHNVSTSTSGSSERPRSPPPNLPTVRRESPGPLALAAMRPRCAATSETPGAGGCVISCPLDVDTPEGLLLHGGEGAPSPRVYSLLGPPSQPQSQPKTLVADTPEQDYGLRVTWRRRKGLMMALERGGHLSKVDTFVPM